MRIFAVFLTAASMLVVKNILSPTVVYILYAAIGSVYLIKNTNNRKKMTLAKSIGTGIFGGTIVFAASLCITFLISLLAGAEGSTSENSNIIGDLIMLVLLPAASEELFFRGMMQSEIERMTDRRKAIVIASVIFAVFHMPIIKIPVMFIAGIVFGYVYFKTGRLSAAITAHAVNNLIAVVMMYLG